MKPLFIVRIDKGYYSAEHPWQEVVKEQASKMTHADARRIRDKLRRPGIRYTNSTVEPA
jgi:hypothetical protein